MPTDDSSNDDSRAVLERLIAEGRAAPASVDHREMLRAIGVLQGPASDAGTRALEEQRAERLP